MSPELFHPLLLALALQLVLPAWSHDHPVARALAIGVMEFHALRYAVWRVTTTLPDTAFTFDALWQWTFLAAEALALTYSCLTGLVLLRRSNLSSLADERERELRGRTTKPSVTVLIPTVNEPRGVLEATIHAATRIDYPDLEICVLDDDKGPRPGTAVAARVHAWLPDLCAHYGVRYLRRRTSAGAKAGNLNHGLAHSTGQVILVLDADFRAVSNILWRLVGLLDESTALVQTPQHYYTTDPIQHNLGGGRSWTEEQRHFFDVMLPARDAWGAAVCVGTGFVVLRRALGPQGFEEACLSEDVYGGYAIRSRGFQVRYLNEPLAFGAAADSLSEYIRQRVRWCQGIIQAIWLPYGPVRAPNLRLVDRLFYAEMPAYWISQFGFLACLLVSPAVYFWTGVPAFGCSSDEAASYLAPRVVSAAMVTYWISCGRQMPIVSEIRNIVALECVLRAIAGLAFAPAGKPFIPTLKGEQRHATVVQWRIMTPLLVLAGLTLAGMGGALFLESSPVRWDEYLPVNIALGLYVTGLLVVSSLACVDRPKDTTQSDYRQVIHGRWLRAVGILVRGAEPTPAATRPAV